MGQRSNIQNAISTTSFTISTKFGQ